MPLRKKGKYYYGDSQIDIKEELLRFSKLNGYPTKFYADAVCVCKENLFNILVDDNEGVAVRHCVNCQNSHPIGDSNEFLEGAELEICECPCGSEIFEVTVGVAVYENSKDVRWIYIGCRCKNCGLTAAYGDWKNEYTDYSELLSRV